VSHDWPNMIERHGDTAGLLRRKPFFRAEVEQGTLGSPPLLELLRALRPRWWFSAHLHVRFEAVYRHAGAQARGDNPDEIVIDAGDDDDDGGGGGCTHAAPIRTKS